MRGRGQVCLGRCAGHRDGDLRDVVEPTRSRRAGAGRSRTRGGVQLGALCGSPDLDLVRGSGRMTLWLRALVIALLDVVSRVAFAAPAFAVRVEGEGIRQYRVTEAMRVSDDFVAARVRASGPDEWELTLKARTRPITSVWFPWEPE